MNNLALAAKKIATQMEAVRNNQLGKDIYIGLGIALGICFEQYTGARPEKVPDLIRWARSLDTVDDLSKRRVV